MVPDGDDVVVYDGFEIGTPSLFNLDPSMIQSILTNVTLSVIAQYHAWPTSANVTRSQAHSKYVFSNPLNLLLPYFLSLGMILPLTIVGYWALCQNGVPARDSGFLQIVMTTRGNKELDQLAAGGCLGGDCNVPPALKKYEVMFGELADGSQHHQDGWAAVGIDDRPVTGDEQTESGGKVALAGFGPKDEVTALRKREPYGVRYKKVW